jgi:hypothetical protein
MKAEQAVFRQGSDALSSGCVGMRQLPDAMSLFFVPVRPQGFISTETCNSRARGQARVAQQRAMAAIAALAAGQFLNARIKKAPRCGALV